MLLLLLPDIVMLLLFSLLLSLVELLSYAKLLQRSKRSTPSKVEAISPDAVSLGQTRSTTFLNVFSRDCSNIFSRSNLGFVCIRFLFTLGNYNLFEDVFDDLVIDSGALKESFVFEIIFLFPN